MVLEVRIFINGQEKRYKLIPSENEPVVPTDPKHSPKVIKATKRNRRRTPSKPEKSFYKKYGKRFSKGSTSCRNEILNEIMEYQKSHPEVEWRITDRNGIYNCLFNNFARAKK